MDGSAGIQAYPDFLHTSTGLAPDVEGSSEVHPCVCERWRFLHSKGREWGWSWAPIWLSFMSSANGALMNDGLDEASSLENPKP